jgi:peptidoglycan biosynthesis protein MviN/MurJ (putative lipid II flippase)
VFGSGLVPFACIKLFGNLSSSLGAGKTPVVSGLIAASSNLILAFTLRSTFLKHNGLALAVVLASIINSMVILWCLRQRIHWIWFLDLVPIGLKILTATLLMGMVVGGWVYASREYSSVVILFGGSLLGGVSYLAAGGLLFREQLQSIWLRVKKKSVK